jgi:hypothetical protein
VRRGGTALAALPALLLLTTCSGTLRFDDHSIDAGASGGNERGTFVGDPCTSEGCEWECPALASCSGKCGLSCSADCEENSTCMLSAEQDARLRCERGARCSFVVGAGSSVECQASSDCGARCLSGCSLACSAGAICTLACGPTAPLAPASGMSRCP